MNLYFAAPTEVRIAGRLSTNQNTYLGPALGTSGLDATDIVLYVNGRNGRNGRVHAGPKAARFGLRNTVVANVYAPNGTLWLRQGTHATGAFLGKWVIAGIRVELTLDSGF